MDSVLDFFGFGREIRKMIALVGCNRTANIIGDTGTCSKSFQLERGRPQGDTLSPITFNFAMQILIIKLEQSNEIRPVVLDTYKRNKEPVQLEQCVARGGDDGKMECFADDANIFAEADVGTLTFIKKTLSDFGILSGLKCNIDKTCVMGIGTDAAFETDAAASGFRTVSAVTILGVEIKKDLSNTDEIFQKIKQKILGLVGFWERFKLTLPGRIMVAKTFLISQLNYVGCFLKPDEKTLNSMQEIIDGFCVKNLKIARNRLYLSPDLGGLGLLDLSVLLQAQRCSWIIRAQKSVSDVWREVLFNLAPGHDITRIYSGCVNKGDHPLLYNFVEDYSNFYGKFCDHVSEIHDISIIGNPAIVWGVEETKFGKNFTRDNVPLNIGQVMTNGIFKTKQELANSGVAITYAQWFNLRAGVSASAKRIQKIREGSFRRFECGIAHFFLRVKKGSRKIRKIISNGTEPVTLQTLKKFGELTGTEPENPGVCTGTTGTNAENERKIRPNYVSEFLGMWDKKFLHNDLRHFLFLERNNALSTNNRANAINPEISPMCNFCRISNRNCRDGFRHLFRECATTDFLLRELCKICEVPVPEPNQFWFGVENGSQDTNKLLLYEIFRYGVWKFKQRRKVPNIRMFLGELCVILTTVTNTNPSVNAALKPILARCKQALG